MSILIVSAHFFRTDSAETRLPIAARTAVQAMLVRSDYIVQPPVLTTLITKNVRPSKVGSVLGVSAPFVGAVSILKPLMSDLHFDEIHPHAPMVVNAILCAAVLLTLLRVFRRVPTSTTAYLPTATGDYL